MVFNSLGLIKQLSSKTGERARVRERERERKREREKQRDLLCLKLAKD